MMDLTKIKVTEIPAKMREWCDENACSTTTRFAAYLEYINGEVVERCFATRLYSRGGVKITEVLRAATGDSSVVAKNLLFSPMAGYRAVYEKEDLFYTSQSWRYKVFSKEDYDVWYNPDGNIGFSYVIINSELIKTIDEFKYSGYTGGGVISYLNAYRKDKSVEFFGKMGLPLSPVLMRLAKSDGKFRRFLWENHIAIEVYGTEAGIYAYQHGVSVAEARRICYKKHQLDKLVAYRMPAIRGTKLDRQKVLDYVDKNNIDYASYDDYLTAIKTMRYDLTDTKNVFPRDFNRMHDLRTAEYSAYKIKQDAKKRKALYRDYRKVVSDYGKYELRGEKYSLIVAKDISDLIREGDVLNHCVGKMGYDKKVVDGVSLIMFCRKNTDPDVPFVTVEYRLDRDALNQCYGDHDSQPPEDVRAFVSGWAKEITKERKDERKNQQRPAVSDRPQVG